MLKDLRRKNSMEAHERFLSDVYASNSFKMQDSGKLANTNDIRVNFAFGKP